MALATTAPLVTIQNGSGASTAVAQGATLNVTPGLPLTFSLTNGTSGIQRWELTFLCPSYPGLHQRTFTWTPGMATTWQVPMPALPVAGNSVLSGIEFISTTSDGSGGAIPQATGFLQNELPSAMPMQQYADYVIVAALPAYTNVSGTLTGNAAGAITSTMADGATPAVGDVFLLEQGLAGAAIDAGLYQITVVGTGAVKFVATALNFGYTMLPKSEILIGTRGTVFKTTTWVNTLAGLTNVVGVASFTFFPRQVTWSSAAVAGVNCAGASATAGAPAVMSVFSLTLTNYVIVRTTANTSTATTGGYHADVPIAGALGTGKAQVFATIAAGTINNADISTLTVTMINPV